MHYYSEQGIDYPQIVDRLSERTDEDCRLAVRILTCGDSPETEKRLWLMAQHYRNSHLVLLQVEPEFKKMLKADGTKPKNWYQCLEINALAVEWYVRQAWAKLKRLN